MSLRWRWAATLAAVAAVAVGLAITAALVATRGELNAQIDRDLLQRVSYAERMGGDGMPPFPEPGFGRRDRLNPLVGLDAIVQFIDETGSVVLKVDSSAPNLPVDGTDLALATGAGEPRLRDVDVDGTHHRMVTAHMGETERFSEVELGAVQVAVDASGVDEALATLTGRLLVLGAIGIALVAGTGWILAGRAVRPIERLTETAESVARTERLDTALDEQAPGEIGRLATAFGSMLRSLESSRRQQQRLVSDASHEFRTPLTALKTSLETLKRRGDSLGSHQRTELIDTALEESDQLADLSAELVALATDVQHSDEPASEVDLNDLVESVAHQFRHRTTSTIVVEGEGDVVTGRRSQLERAVANLVDNATKWSPDGATITIRLAGRRLSVHDQGPGIADEDLPHVFERFYRAVDAHSKPGSGLGLAIVEHIITAHDGNVFASAAEGGGTVVGFELPAG